MDLAKNLLRTTARSFYTTEEVLIVDALCIHSTLTDADLAHCLGTNRKELRKQCGKLKDHGLVSVQSRAEKKEDAPPPSTNPNFKNRDYVKHQDWYWLHYHPAIDAIKFRLSKLSKHVDNMGAPTTEKKDLECPRCKSQYTDLEVMDNIDPISGSFLCHKCEHALDEVDQEVQKGENESKKRLNTQVGAIESLLRGIDSANVPENDFDTALSLHLPINRGDAHPDRPNTIAEEVKPSIAGSKGLTLAPEKVSVQLEDDVQAKPDPEAVRIKREKEARQNALPDWITNSTISGAVTAAGAKEERERREREAHAGSASLAIDDAAADEKKLGGTPGRDDAVMDDYWAAYQAEQERARLQEQQDEDEEDEEEDEDEFEDVGLAAKVPNIKVEEVQSPSSKRVKMQGEADSKPLASVAPAVDANAESDEDDMEFEDV
jgi:transcription initiation factor TFIIE subunit alpha